MLKRKMKIFKRGFNERLKEENGREEMRLLKMIIKYKKE